MDALLPLDANKLSKQEKKTAIASLIFLTEKNGTIKARQCADGRKQRPFMLKEDSTSPTITTESIFITSVINAKENRDVAIVDLLEPFYMQKTIRTLLCLSEEDWLS